MPFDSLVLPHGLLLVFAFVSICLNKASSLEPPIYRLVDEPPLSLHICEAILHLSSPWFLLSFSGSFLGCPIFVFHYPQSDLHMKTTSAPLCFILVTSLTH
ncbi:hypothetical protein J3E69DRAFT_321869 [Trichoderma sp. SZMC 28015]